MPPMTPAEQLVEQAGVAGRLAGVDELAAAVEVVAHGDASGTAGARRPSCPGAGRRAPKYGRLGDDVLLVLGQPVVAEVPEDGRVVAEHAEVVRHALGVDVPDVGLDAVGLQRRHVLVDVLRRGPDGVSSGL